jgi:hypothetical protein
MNELPIDLNTNFESSQHTESITQENLVKTLFLFFYPLGIEFDTHGSMHDFSNVMGFPFSQINP